MKRTAYIETTVISCLTALPSRDLILAAHQQVTRDWWSARDAFSCMSRSSSWMKHRLVMPPRPHVEQKPFAIYSSST